ncbi:hypothetical protein FF1_016484 [Malus domestica]
MRLLLKVRLFIDFVSSYVSNRIFYNTGTRINVKRLNGKMTDDPLKQFLGIPRESVIWTRRPNTSPSPHCLPWRPIYLPQNPEKLNKIKSGHLPESNFIGKSSSFFRRYALQFDGVGYWNKTVAKVGWDLSLAARLKRLYESWEDSPDVGFVLMKREGLLFWADAVSLYQLVNEGNVDECKKFFEMLYKFMHIQGTYLKPHVAIMDGITMGAGAVFGLAREYRTSLAAISNRVSSDFSEGVRARLVDKDFAPKWNPPSLKDVAKDMVDCYFSRLPEAADIIARDIYAREIHPKNETELVKTLVSSRVVKSFRNRVVSAES